MGKLYGNRGFDIGPIEFKDSSTEYWITHGDSSGPYPNWLKKKAAESYKNSENPKVTGMLKDIVIGSIKATRDAYKDMLKEGVENIKGKYAEFFPSQFGLNRGIFAQSSIDAAKRTGDFINLVPDEKEVYEMKK